MGNDWDEIFRADGEWKKTYYCKLRAFLKNAYRTHTVYPHMNDIFNALKYTSYADTKAVILGQDPYHQPGQAHGLCFSVKDGVPPPPSLLNIFKELYDDCGIVPPLNGELTNWAKSGVLLLNTVLTVQEGMANSHKNQGWEILTDRIIEVLNARGNLVFILWGANAKAKATLITNRSNLILTGAHPSPLSANRGGFFGGKYFSRTNAFLNERGIEQINWRLSDNIREEGLRL